MENLDVGREGGREGGSHTCAVSEEVGSRWAAVAGAGLLYPPVITATGPEMGSDWRYQQGRHDGVMRDTQTISHLNFKSNSLALQGSNDDLFLQKILFNLDD